MPIQILLSLFLSLLLISCQPTPKEHRSSDPEALKTNNIQIIDVGKQQKTATQEPSIALQSLDSIESNLSKLYKGYDNDEFSKALKKVLLDSRTFKHPFNKLKLEDQVRIFDYNEEGFRLYSYIWSAGSGYLYKTLIQYYDNKGNINVKELDLYNEMLYDTHKFKHKSQSYYILFSYGTYSGKSWSENLRIATITNGELTLHGHFFPNHFIKRDLKKNDYLSIIWNLDNDEEKFDLPLNGYIHDNCLTLHNGSSVTAKTLNLKFNKQKLSFSYNELKRTHPLFVEPTGKRLKFRLNLN